MLEKYFTKIKCCDIVIVIIVIIASVLGTYCELFHVFLGHCIIVLSVILAWIALFQGIETPNLWKIFIPTLFFGFLIAYQAKLSELTVNINGFSAKMRDLNSLSDRLKNLLKVLEKKLEASADNRKAFDELQKMAEGKEQTTAPNGEANNKIAEQTDNAICALIELRMKFSKDNEQNKKGWSADNVSGINLMTTSTQDIEDFCDRSIKFDRRVVYSVIAERRPMLNIYWKCNFLVKRYKKENSLINTMYLGYHLCRIFHLPGKIEPLDTHVICGYWEKIGSKVQSGEKIPQTASPSYIKELIDKSPVLKNYDL